MNDFGSQTIDAQTIEAETVVGQTAKAQPAESQTSPNDSNDAENASKNSSLRVPGELMLHPVALICVGLLALNDHYLKANFGNAITGKLSDFAGLVFFPLFLISGWEILRCLFDRTYRFGASSIIASHLTTFVLFVSINVHEGAGRLYARSMTSVWSCLGANGGHATYVTDPSDLLALPMLIVPFVLAHRQMKKDA